MKVSSVRSFERVFDMTKTARLIPRPYHGASPPLQSHLQLAPVWSSSPVCLCQVLLLLLTEHKARAWGVSRSRGTDRRCSSVRAHLPLHLAPVWSSSPGCLCQVLLLLLTEHKARAWGVSRSRGTDRRCSSVRAHLPLPRPDESIVSLQAASFAILLFRRQELRTQP